jgi:hypothetical protein
VVTADARLSVAAKVIRLVSRPTIRRSMTSPNSSLTAATTMAANWPSPSVIGGDANHRGRQVYVFVPTAVLERIAGKRETGQD